ncbi:hypothetical protein [Maritalea mediterranea]|uniref:Uncharacterized protein n=1 Tax=Maritalea mediterranea TaxID=2909667 RepID=A0ABS9E3V5_9HYPH|nr:hypothetical protein [Maritalea mediterranea]MCF4097487.1 hypothetical protein [Maritalea mediterranea]
MKPVSLLRLYLLRGCYLLLLVGLSIQIVPDLFGPVVTMPMMDGVVTAMLSALAVLSILGLFAPIFMLPLLWFELSWKLIWVLFVALPRWQTGTMDEATIEVLFACAFVVPFVFIIPWRYAIGRYMAALDPWRTKSD